MSFFLGVQSAIQSSVPLGFLVVPQVVVDPHTESVRFGVVSWGQFWGTNGGGVGGVLLGGGIADGSAVGRVMPQGEFSVRIIRVPYVGL